MFRSQRVLLRFLVISGFLGLGIINMPTFSEADEPKAVAANAKAERVFELRTYVTHPGRLPALHKRFREHTNKLFQKHGMELVGYWTPAEGPDSENTLIYILAHKSREAAKKSWEGFRADAEWITARDASEKDGPIVLKVESKFLAPTDYSDIK